MATKKFTMKEFKEWTVGDNKELFAVKCKVCGSNFGNHHGMLCPDKFSKRPTFKPDYRKEKKT
jgi:hypothetical protein